MTNFSDTIQQADWKTEKHAPIIEAPATAKAGDFIEVTVSLGKAIAHPNTPQHFISWIFLYFLPEGAKFPLPLARCEFSAHGASITDAPTPALTAPKIVAQVKLSQSGTLQAVSFCNIHGAWQTAQEIKIEA